MANNRSEAEVLGDIRYAEDMGRYADIPTLEAELAAVRKQAREQTEAFIAERKSAARAQREREQAERDAGAASSEEIARIADHLRRFGNRPAPTQQDILDQGAWGNPVWDPER